MLTKTVMLAGLLLPFATMVFGQSNDTDVSNADTRKMIFTVCARMDVWGLSEVAEKLCIGACCSQNCGTGTCIKRDGRPVCVCSRCADGGGGGVGCFVGK